MEAKELRIGNYVKEEENIICVDIDDIKFYSDIKNKYTPQPIPLTEDILLKCGFEKVLNQYTKETETKPFIILFLDNQFQYDDLRYRTNLQYVNQLQNLYFALTNQELTITL